MKNIVPNFNKTQLKRVLESHPPGSHYGFIDWKNIVVRRPKGDDTETWKEAYIPFRLSTDSYTTVKEIESIFRTIERVWGEICTPFKGTKGLISYKGKSCVYVCFEPKVSGEIRR